MVETAKQGYIIGIDVGGTNTDSVLFEFPDKKIIAAYKTVTTQDVQRGVIESIEGLFKQRPDINKDQIKSVMLGTTAFLNAFLQASNELSPVSVVRLCKPSTLALPPFSDWPMRLRYKIEQRMYMVKGGNEISGEEISALDETELIAVANELVDLYREQSVKILNIVINGVFSPVNSDQEKKACKIFEKVFNEAKIDYTLTMANEIAQLGLLEREAASIMNASLLQMAKRQIWSFKNALEKQDLMQASIFLTQNDGTLISADFAMKFPVYTFSSGPTNSLRGASELTGIKDAIVVDVGGTTTDVAPLEKGFPRDASAYVNIGGVRTNFRMPDTFSVPLGGGSIIKFNDDGSVTVGPQSVGYRIKEESVCFGQGSVITATDIAVAAGHAQIEGAVASRVNLTQEQIQKAMQQILKIIEDAIDQVKTQAGDQTIILVGGGAILVPKDAKFVGVKEIIIPEHFGNANALGAAIAQVSYEVDRIVALESRVESEVLQEIKDEVTREAIKAGALEGSIEIIPDVIPISYGNKSSRFKVKAIGQLSILQGINDTRSETKKTVKVSQKHLEESKVDIQIDSKDQQQQEEGEVKVKEQEVGQNYRQLDETVVEIPKERHYEEVNGRKEWVLNFADIDCIALGAGILGTGGGGTPYISTIVCKNILKDGYKMRVIDPQDLKDDEYSCPVAFLGAPSVAIEKIQSGTEVQSAFQELNAYFEGKRNIACLMPIEIGGLNGMIPLITAAKLGMPVLDCDGMGRAYPRVEMTSFYINGISSVPCSCADEKGNVFIAPKVQGSDPRGTEKFLRTVAISYGLFLGVCLNPLSQPEIRDYGIHHQLTRCWNLGKAILEARKQHSDPMDKLRELEKAEEIFRGKLIEVKRDNEQGFNKGYAKIQGIEDFRDKQLKVEFQNENLVAYYEGEDNNREYIATVPDLICILDKERYSPILCEDLKYGLRVTVIVIPAVPLMSNEKALKVIGPEIFGYKNINLQKPQL